MESQHFARLYQLVIRTNQNPCGVWAMKPRRRHKPRDSAPKLGRYTKSYPL